MAKCNQLIPMPFKGLSNIKGETIHTLRSLIRGNKLKAKLSAVTMFN